MTNSMQSNNLNISKKSNISNKSSNNISRNSPSNVASVASRNSPSNIASLASRNSPSNVASVASRNSPSNIASVASRNMSQNNQSKSSKITDIVLQNSFMKKLNEIFTSMDMISNIIKICILIIFILLCLIVGTIITKLDGNLKYAVIYFCVAILSYLLGEIGIPKIIGNDYEQVSNIIGVIFIINATLLVLYSIKLLITHFKNGKINSPWILKGTKVGRKSMVIPQNPKNPDTVILYRSDNQEDGIEFTYNFWMLIEDYGYKTNDWKHVFHKGDKNAEPNMCPGVYLHPNQNTMRIYLNTMKNIKEHIDITDIPLKKWIHVAIILKQKKLEVYINGYMKRSHTLTSIPRQNFGDVWLNLRGGFDGYISKLRYHRKALEYHEVEKLISEGPSKSACIDSDSLPPYLDNEWWLKRD